MTQSDDMRLAGMLMAAQGRAMQIMLELQAKSVDFNHEDLEGLFQYIDDVVEAFQSLQAELKPLRTEIQARVKQLQDQQVSEIMGDFDRGLDGLLGDKDEDK